MNIHGVIKRNALRLHLAGAMLCTLLQREPVPCLRLTAETLRAAAPIVALLRAMTTAAATSGALHAQTGATQFAFSQPHPVRGTVGEPLAVAFTIIAAPSQPNRFFVHSALPPGLTTIPEMDGNRIASGTPVITGTPTQAGLFAVDVTGSDGFHALSHTLTFEIAEPPSPGRLTHVSILTELTANNPELAVTATLDGNTAPADLLVRAVGPSLAPLGVGSPLSNPRIELARAEVNVAANDDWQGDPALQNAFARAGAFPLAESTSADAALVATATAGDYTARVRAANDAAGTVLLEAFVLPNAASGGTEAHLPRGSLRHLLRDDAALVLGFVITGQSPATLSFDVRTEAANLASSDADAELALFDAAGAQVAWPSDVPAPSLQLQPGTYSLHLRARNGTTPVIIEWAEVP